MMRPVHPLMKDANNRDAVVGDAEINHMPLDIAAAIVDSRPQAARGQCLPHQVHDLKHGMLDRSIEL